jgi:hypothetical protein
MIMMPYGWAPTAAAGHRACRLMAPHTLIPFGDDLAPHRANVMFGTLKIEYGGGSGPHWVREGDGVWRSLGARPRNRRLAAVLFASRLTPWTIGQTELEWWDNPFASQPVPAELLPDVATRRQLRPDQTGEINMHATRPARTPGSVLDPESSWG